MSHQTTILFDLDGTLVDTAPDLLSALNEVLRTVDAAPVTIGQLRTMVGQGARVMIERGLRANDRPATPGDIDKLIGVFLDFYGAHVADESRPFPGVIECLQQLQARGAKLAVCTNKFAGMSQRLLDALDMSQFFETVAGGDTYPVRKPHPDHLLLTMKALGGSVGRTIMIGDSEPDVAAAKAASMPVIGVTFGYTPVPIADLRPDLLVDHFDQMLPAIDRLLLRQTAG